MDSFELYAGSSINGYKKRTLENIVSLSKIFDLEGCLEEVRMGANKQISCKICSKVMRSDNLSRHMKKHADPSLEDPEQICKSILEDVIIDIYNKDETSMYRKKT